MSAPGPISPAKRPFVLLDDARTHGAAPARLFSSPSAIASAATPDEVTSVLADVERWTAAGGHAAGFLCYEAGCALEPRLQPHLLQGPEDWPFAWFGRFSTCSMVAPDEVASLLPDGAGAAVNAPVPTISRDDYDAAIADILAHIRAGNIYQANLTFAASVAMHGAPLAIYARLRDHARAGYGGVVYTGRHWLLSLSPELFFSLRDRRIMVRPMKGTASRERLPERDREAAAHLAADPKQRAENLMIVDLLRNDLSRVATPGSVTVEHLFRVETYPTVHQMVSDISADLRPGVGPAEVIANLFPCGSITGAPKISAMTIIAGTEQAPRGPYTGSIGFFAPDGSGAFNVAIRTLALREGDDCATLGLGSGIVADSAPAEEWRECLAKGEFVRVATANFDLLETMHFSPDAGIALLDRHLERLGGSARTFGYAFDRHAIRNMLQHATFHYTAPARVRIRLSPSGAAAILVDALPAAADEPVSVAVVPRPVPATDIRLRHKTSDRAFYEAARAASGAFDALLVDDEGFVTEGCISNVFIKRDDALVTPPLARGLLPGVLRAELLASGRAVEGDVHVDELDGPFFIGNALRGLMRARRI